MSKVGREIFRAGKMSGRNVSEGNVQGKFLHSSRVGALRPVGGTGLGYRGYNQKCCTIFLYLILILQ